MPKRNIKDLFIAKGEQVSIKAVKMTRYSIGNKEVLKHVFKKSSEEIFLKGKSIGFSDLIVWKKNKKEHFHVYVLSKKRQLQQMHIASILKRINLVLLISGELIIASGEIDSLESYFIIQNLKKQNINNLILNITLSKTLLKKIYTNIYIEAYRFGAKLVNCKHSNLTIFCSIDGLDLKSHIIQNLQKKYQVEFDSNISRIHDRNYVAKFKIIQIESLEQSTFKLGLSQLSSPLINLIQGRHISLIEGEAVNISQLNIKATLLSEPQSTITLNTKSSLSLGGEFPTPSTSASQQGTIIPAIEWTFYGLKITTFLKNKNGSPFVKYSAKLTTPKGNSIEGTKAQSSLYLEMNKYQKLFEIGHSFSEKHQKGIPILKEIPFLKALFSESGKSSTYKHIICYISLEEQE